jgi:HemY protein
VLAAKFLSEAHQIRRAMRILETAWVAQPHPDLAEAYAHVRLGDSARQRLTRVETLAAKVPGHVEGALAIARQAIDAREFARAREVLAPLIAAPTQRVAMLMAEIERAEHGDDGRARGWMLKALRAAHDPVWTADGYVSERWRAVSPVTGRLDAFQWQTPLAALPSDRPIDAAAERALSSPRAALPATGGDAVLAAAGRSDRVATAPGGAAAAIAPVATTAQDNAPPAAAAAPDAGRAAAPPLFRGQSGVRPAPAVPPVIPIVRAPDDPGVDDTEAGDEFGAAAEAPPAQRGGWRGFLSRFGA